MPVSKREDPDCSIEIATLNLEDIKEVFWWSNGIDLFAGKIISMDEKKDMKTITGDLLSNYPMDNLTLANSYSYPRLFNLNRDIKKVEV
jgi:hypothetical protein